MDCCFMKRRSHFYQEFEMLCIKQFVVVFLGVSVVRAGALYFGDAASDKKVDRVGINEVSDAVTSFLAKANNFSLDLSKHAIKERCLSVLDVELEAYHKELALTNNATVDGICCQCNRCQRQCRACGRNCCCKGDQGCRCVTCGQSSESFMEMNEVSFVSASTSTPEWLSKAKSHLKQVMTSFLEQEMVTLQFCCSCSACTRWCSACGRSCCCSGSGCSCSSCSTGSPLFEMSGVSNNLDANDIPSHPEVKAILVMVEELVNNLVTPA